MPKEIGPSSYECDCGYVAQFSENAVRDLKQRSLMKRQWLSEGGEAGRHIVVFEGGKMTMMLCSHDGRHEEPPPRFTVKQGRYLGFIHQYTILHGVPPAEHEMQQFFQVSPPTVHQMILTLERKGLIRRTPGAARSIQVLVPTGELGRLT
jgi:repressor LexA